MSSLSTLEGLPGSVVIQMEAVSPEPVVADGGQRSSDFLHGGYGHAGIGIGLELPDRIAGRGGCALKFTEYHELDITGKLIWNFRNISHILRGMSGGKGSQRRILTVLLKSGQVTQTELTEYPGIRPGSASEELLSGLSGKEQEELLALLEKLAAHCKESGLDERREHRWESDCRGNGGIV